eukprot:SAG31_NODE_3034_length_4763_cov_8.243782_4_plen_77_part_00
MERAAGWEELQQENAQLRWGFSYHFSVLLSNLLPFAIQCYSVLSTCAMCLLLCLNKPIAWCTGQSCNWFGRNFRLL